MAMRAAVVVRWGTPTRRVESFMDEERSTAPVEANAAGAVGLGDRRDDQPAEDRASATWILRSPFVWLVPVIVGAVVRAAYWAVVTPDWIPNADADQYLRLARALADGDGYSLVFPQLEMHATAFRPPLYPALLSIPTWIFGDDVLWPSRLLSLLISLGVIALTVVFVRRMAGPLAGVVAGIAVAVTPNLVANDTVTLTEPLALLLLVGLLIALDDERAVLSGILLGLLFLTRPNAYLILIVVVVTLWRLVGWRKALIGLACCAAVVVPWLVRNQVQVGTFRLATSDGFTMAAIYGPPAQERGRFVDPVFDPWYEDHRDGEFKVLQFDEAEWTGRLSTLAIDSLRENPTYLIDVVWHNMLNVLEVETAPNRVADGLDGRNVDFVGDTLPLYYVLLVVGFLGLLSQAANRRLWPAFGVVGGTLLLSLLLVAPPRLRSPMELLLCMGVGFAVAWVVEHRRGAIPDLDGI